MFGFVRIACYFKRDFYSDFSLIKTILKTLKSFVDCFTFVTETLSITQFEKQLTLRLNITANQQDLNLLNICAVCLRLM